MPSVGFAHRPVARGHQALVASAHPLATLAGLDVLRGGGTAADAAIAVNSVLAVVQPHMCGVGGDLFLVGADAGRREVVYLDSAGRSGSGATLEALRASGLTAVPLAGPLAVSVPGCAAGWGALAARYGTRPLGELLKPAVALAAEGFPCTDLLAAYIRERAPAIDDPEWHRISAPGGQAPRPGARLRQPDLARSLELIADQGPDALYRGEIGERIARRLQAGGGFLTAGDLAAHEARWRPPIATT